MENDHKPINTALVILITICSLVSILSLFFESVHTDHYMTLFAGGSQFLSLLFIIFSVGLIIVAWGNKENKLIITDSVCTTALAILIIVIAGNKTNNYWLGNLEYSALLLPVPSILQLILSLAACRGRK